MNKKLRMPLFLLAVLISAGASAQTVRLAGYLRDSLTHFPVAGTVTNASTGQKVQTAANGFFMLQAKPGQGLTASAPAYRYQVWTVPQLYADTVTIYLPPTGITLENVTVEARYSKYQMDSMSRRNTFEELRGNPLKTVSRPNSGAFGIALNLDRASKQQYRNQQQKERFFQQREREAYIDYWFSPQVVARYTGLQGDALRLFLYQHRPKYEWLRTHHSNESLVLYLSERLKQFRTTTK